MTSLACGWFHYLKAGMVDYVGLTMSVCYTVSYYVANSVCANTKSTLAEKWKKNPQKLNFCLPSYLTEAATDDVSKSAKRAKRGNSGSVFSFKATLYWGNVFLELFSSEVELTQHHDVTRVRVCTGQRKVCAAKGGRKPSRRAESSEERLVF